MDVSVDTLRHELKMDLESQCTSKEETPAGSGCSSSSDATRLRSGSSDAISRRPAVCGNKSLSVRSRRSVGSIHEVVSSTGPKLKALLADV
ncbi:hypothetical protein BaRGS_00000464 [Batillaria attramentaria]|uniref:Uncharacterized protein n=1 Tax=Batillaria attramentaria TaxID=370345 RepID=A0ABD0M9A5_9CAEN